MSIILVVINLNNNMLKKSNTNNIRVINKFKDLKL